MDKDTWIMVLKEKMKDLGIDTSQLPVEDNVDEWLILFVMNALVESKKLKNKNIDLEKRIQSLESKQAASAVLGY